MVDDASASARPSPATSRSRLDEDGSCAWRCRRTGADRTRPRSRGADGKNPLRSASFKGRQACIHVGSDQRSHRKNRPRGGERRLGSSGRRRYRRVESGKDCPERKDDEAKVSRTRAAGASTGSFLGFPRRCPRRHGPACPHPGLSRRQARALDRARRASPRENLTGAPRRGDEPPDVRCG